MKKLLSVLLCVAMLMTAAAVSATATDLSSEVTDDTWNEAELQALVYIQGAWCASDMAEDYDNDEWFYVDEMELTDGSFETYATVNMRGFTMSPDRKFAYMGFLNGGSAFRGCAMFDMETGAITDVYYRYDQELADLDDPAYRFSFAKGLAADDRGYVYVGFALSANYNLVTLGIAKANYETKKLEEVYNGAIYEYGTPGDQGGIHVGVNGVDVAKVGDRYLCYAVINYDVDRIVCYDVTDPAHPEPYKEFGVDGVLEMHTADDPVYVNDAYYMDVDEDGTVWLCAKMGDGSTKVNKIAPDGSGVVGTVEDGTAYCVAHAGSYIITGAKDGSAINVYDDSSFEKVGSVKFDTDAYGIYFSMVQVIDDILIVADSDNNDGGAFNAIMVAPLTADAQAKVDEMVENLNGKSGEADTEADTAADTAEATEAPTAADTTPAVTEADATTPATEAQGTEGGTEKADEGCGSVMGLAAVYAVIVAGIGFMMGKKH
ncbi:MAG: hypothetical protein MJ192_01310 [Clostridia bacterium]|nr:hypothetical protein [Clostridia bacterium]